MTSGDLDVDGDDPFEAFNRNAGMGIDINPYEMAALVRPEHPIRREDITMAIADADVEIMPLDASVGIYTAYSYEAVQQVLKDGDAFSSKAYADIMGQV